MNRIKSLRPTPALIVALVALVAAMSGAAVALPGKNSVTSNDIVTGAITQKKIAKGAIGSQQILGKSIKGNRLKDGAIRDDQLADGSVTTAKLGDDAVTGAKIADGAVTGAQVGSESLSSANISDYKVVSSADGSFVKLTATEAATEAAARTAAPETTLFTKGTTSITAKCFRDTAGDQTFAEIYVKTSANGAVFNGGTDALQGGNAATDFLNTNTLEIDSQQQAISTTAGGPDATFNENEFSIIGADGAHLIGQTSAAAKNGALAGGDGVYGAGNVCVFGGEISG